MTIKTGRHTTDFSDTVTVFLLGMRVNHLHRPDLWLPVALATPRMQHYLRRRPQAGLLGYHQWFGRTTIMVSYWRSIDDLHAFAADPDGPHLGPWRAFRKHVGNPAVGIWHETYVVPATSREAVYVNMPVFGLARATRHVPVSAGSRTARQRLSTGT